MLRYSFSLSSTLIIAIVCSTEWVAQGQQDLAALPTTGPVTRTFPASTPAMQIVAAARDASRLNPKRFDLHNVLATGLIRRARETGDDTFYTRPAETVATSLRLPGP